MILAVDVHYRSDNSATAAGVLFESWESGEAAEEVVVEMADAAGYLPGKFFLRELPCIEKLLSHLGCSCQCIVIDGYVFLGKDMRPGLGMHLWEALRRTVPVIGVAKSKFAETPEESALFRGSSRRPLYVTSIGIALVDAKDCIRRMKGEHRMPVLLKRVDRLTKQGCRFTSDQRFNSC